MDNFASLYSIKKDNTRLVLEAIARSGSITKLDISEQTALSLMTVGKITSTLVETGIIVHEKNMSQKMNVSYCSIKKMVVCQMPAIMV